MKTISIASFGVALLIWLVGAVPADAKCYSDSECKGGKCRSGKCTTAGGKCYSDSECAGGKCRSGRCTGSK